MRKLTTLDKVQFVTGTVAASGDNTLIAAQGAKRQIVIVGMTLQNNSGVDTLLIVKFGSTARYTLAAVAKGDGVALPIPGESSWELGDNTALVLNLSGANSTIYNIQYFIDAG